MHFLSARRLRVASGLVLFTYLALHLFNHALALCSISLAQAGLDVAVVVWRSLPGTLVLYGAALMHLAVALRTIALRQHWRLPPVEILRLWAGFSLPLLLIGHIVMTRVHPTIAAPPPNYQIVVTSLVSAGAQGWQVALLAPGWVHGCLGLWLSLRRFAAMRRLKPVLIAIMVGLPIAAAWGFLRMAREIEQAEVPPPLHALSEADRLQALAWIARLAPWRESMMAVYLVALAAAAFISLYRIRRLRRVSR